MSRTLGRPGAWPLLALTTPAWSQALIKDRTLNLCTQHTGSGTQKVSQNKKLIGMLIWLYKISSCHFGTHGGLLDVGNKTMSAPTYSIKESSGPSAHTCEVVWNGWHLSDVRSDICMDQLLTVSFPHLWFFELGSLIRMDGKQVWQFLAVIGT